MVESLRYFFFSLGDNNKYQDDHLAHFQLRLFDYLFRFVSQKQLNSSESLFSLYCWITNRTNK